MSDDDIPLELRQQVLKLAQTISGYYSDPLSFDHEKAAQLVESAEPRKSMDDLVDLYLKGKEDQGVRPKSVRSQKSRLNVLKANGWDVDLVKQVLQQKERSGKTIVNWMATFATFNKLWG